METDMENQHHEKPTEWDLWNALPELEGIERARACFDLSGLTFENGQYMKSLTLAEEARDCYLELEDKYGYAHSLATVAFSLYSLDRKDEGAVEMMKTVMVFNEIGAKEEWEHRGYLASWFKDIDDLSGAREQYMKCLEHFEYEENREKVAYLNQQIGFVDCQLGSCTDAIEKYKRSREINVTLKDVKQVAETDIHLARCYNHQKEGALAELHAMKAIAIFDSVCTRDKRAQAYSQLGRAKNNQGEFETALQAFEKAHGIVSKEREVNYYGLMTIQKGMAKALRGLGRDAEAVEVEARNEIINETLKWEPV
jgi:tetratricopeptide (TPR) repeat protein